MWGNGARGASWWRRRVVPRRAARMPPVQPRHMRSVTVGTRSDLPALECGGTTAEWVIVLALARAGDAAELQWEYKKSTRPIAGNVPSPSRSRCDADGWPWHTT